MITLHQLNWSNFLSYGDDNSLRLDQYPITQLFGENGAGKTSIAIALEELFTNKNHRGFKKSELPNRNNVDQGLRISCTFSKDSDEYYIEQRRTSSRTAVKILKNGEDVSSHRVTDTYKILEEIFGMPTSLLAKLLYQSSKQSLEFLTTTDAKRKEFLVTFLNLDFYSDLHNKSKEISKVTDSSIADLEKQESYLQGIIEREKDSKPIPFMDVPFQLESLQEEREKVQEKLSEVNRRKTLEKKIADARNEITNIKFGPLPINLPPFEETPPESNNLESTIKENSKEINSMTRKRLDIEKALAQRTAVNQCVRCGKILANTENAEEAREEAQLELEELTKLIEEKNKANALLKEEFKKWQAEYDRYITLKKEYDSKVKKNLELEKANKNAKEKKNKLTQQIEIYTENLEGLPEADHSEVEKLAEIQKAIEETEKAIAHNKVAKEFNEKLKEKLAKVAKSKEDLKLCQEELKATRKDKSCAEVLIKATKGLISYKIEQSAYALEKLINTYLQKFSEGRFSLKIRVKGDKLPIIVYDYGHEVGIHTLSQGELSWVNVSTLLAIRKLLSTIAGTTLNFLMLDELTGVLDEFSNEKLIDILLEEDLNTILVSHNYSHPLVHGINVVKDNSGTSRIVDETERKRS